MSLTRLRCCRSPFRAESSGRLHHTMLVRTSLTAALGAAAAMLIATTSGNLSTATGASAASAMTAHPQTAQVDLAALADPLTQEPPHPGPPPHPTPPPDHSGPPPGHPGPPPGHPGPPPGHPGPPPGHPGPPPGHHGPPPGHPGPPPGWHGPPAGWHPGRDHDRGRPGWHFFPPWGWWPGVINPDQCWDNHGRVDWRNYVCIGGRYNGYLVR
jgi:hypothetical protein